MLSRVTPNSWEATCLPTCSKNSALEQNTGFEWAAFVYFYTENQDYKYDTETSQQWLGCIQKTHTHFLCLSQPITYRQPQTSKICQLNEEITPKHILILSLVEWHFREYWAILLFQHIKKAKCIHSISPLKCCSLSIWTTLTKNRLKRTWFQCLAQCVTYLHLAFL